MWFDREAFVAAAENEEAAPPTAGARLRYVRQAGRTLG